MIDARYPSYNQPKIEEYSLFVMININMILGKIGI